MSKALWIVLIIVLGGGGIFLSAKGIYTLFFQDTDTQQPFTAVFLSNNQVYFGHVVEATEDVIVLERVYYLKTSTAVASLEDNTDQPDNSAEAKLLLVKLGSELHRPHDRMAINRAHVLFMEEMKNEGPIMEAIALDMQ